MNFQLAVFSPLALKVMDEEKRKRAEVALSITCFCLFAALCSQTFLWKYFKGTRKKMLFVPPGISPLTVFCEKFFNY